MLHNLNLISLVHPFKMQFIIFKILKEIIIEVKKRTYKILQ